MLKFACQNLPSKCSTGMTQISLAFGTSMTLLFTKNKQNISDIDKFTYLKLYLCYSANSVISVLTLTSENYKETIDLLRQWYANPQVLISARMKKFVSLNNVKSGHDVKGLRKLFDMVESSIRNLKTLKVEVNSYGSLLKATFKCKASKGVKFTNCSKFWRWRLIFGRHDESLKKWHSSKGTVVVCRNFFLFKWNNCHGDQSFSEDDYSLSALVNSSHKQSKKQCVFCNLKNHKSYKCLRVTEPAARNSKTKKNCFICFDFGHVAKNGDWDYKCKKCNGKHNVSICTFSNNQGDLTQMKKTVKILAQITSQPIREVFCCKLHILKFQTLVHRKKPKSVCYSIREVKGLVSVIN